MKNIYMLQTDKPSRIYRIGDFLLLDNKSMSNNTLGGKNQHIYIISEEDGKQGDYVVFDNQKEKKKDREICVDKLGESFIIFGDSIHYEGTLNADNSYWEKLCKKIILTDDEDLIKDGVQAINDEFLEWFVITNQWFVKNPNCEEVKVQKFTGLAEDYLIIIPKEEPMSYEEFRENASNDLIRKFDTDCSRYSEDGNSDNYFYANCKYWENKLKEEPKQEGYICPQTKKQCDDECCVNAENCHIESSKGLSSEPEQETLEEAITRLQEKYDENGYDCNPLIKLQRIEQSIDCTIKFYSDQLKTMYSEEYGWKLTEMLYKLAEGKIGVVDALEWFEQFKKK